MWFIRRKPRQPISISKKLSIKSDRQYQVTVATSDGLEQVIIMGQGAHRISAQGLKKEIEDTEKAARAEWHQQPAEQQNLSF